jgi:hypothetical protein
MTGCRPPTSGSGLDWMDLGFVEAMKGPPFAAGGSLGGSNHRKRKLICPAGILSLRLFGQSRVDRAGRAQ